MIRLSAILVLALLIGACGSEDYGPAADPYADYERYGDDTMVSEALPARTVAERGEEYDGQDIQVEGTITEVCQSKGCWFLFQTAGENVIRVHVPKDDDGEYLFTLPEDVSGRHSVATGTLEAKELSGDEREHYAGESESGQAAAVEYRLHARSVLVAPSA